MKRQRGDAQSAASWQDGDVGSGTATSAQDCCSADLIVEFNCKNTFAPQAAQRGQLQAVWALLQSLAFLGMWRCPGWHVSRRSQGSRFALGIPSPVSSCATFRCLMPLCRDAAQGFVPPNLLFNFCFLLKVLPVPGRMSS